ncbi:MAG: hypothetical protein WB615_15565 [Candidatus Tumulicola sp.]
MARRYVLADRMFPLEFGPSFTAHLSLIAANTLSRRNRWPKSMLLTQSPRAFTPIPAKYPESRFLNERPSFVPPDDE